jgi:hypothetical protein
MPGRVKKMAKRSRTSNVHPTMTKKKIPPEKLHALLEEEFRATAAGLCRACSVPRPIFRESASGTSNWRVGALDECSGLCHSILSDVAARLAERYDITR